MTDSQSGFRAFASSAKGVFRFKQNGLAIESEMLADAVAAGLRIKEVEIGVRYDVDGSTENPVAHGASHKLKGAVFKLGLAKVYRALQTVQYRSP